MRSGAALEHFDYAARDTLAVQAHSQVYLSANSNCAGDAQDASDVAHPLLHTQDA